MPLFQQNVQGASATNSGLLLLPMVVPVAIVASYAGKFMSRTGRYRIFPVMGTALLTASTLLLSTMDAGTPFWLTSGYLAIAGAGLGMTMQMAGTIAQNSVALTDLGVASAATALFRTLGGFLGVAVFGSLLTAATRHSGIADSPAHRTAVATGTSHIFLLAAAVCAVGFLLALSIREVSLRSSNSAGRPSPALQGETS